MSTFVKAFVETPGGYFVHWCEIDPETIFQDGPDIVQRIQGIETSRWPHGRGIWMGKSCEVPLVPEIEEANGEPS